MSTALGHGIGTPWQRELITDDLMKYSQTINLTGGVEDDITTTLLDSRTIYNIFLEDSSGNVIEDEHQIRSATSGGVWHVYIYSTDALANVVLKIIC